MTKTLREEIQEQLEWVWEQGRGFDTKHHDREYERALTKDKTAQILSLIKSHLKPLTEDELYALWLKYEEEHPLQDINFDEVVSQSTVDKIKGELK